MSTLRPVEPSKNTMCTRCGQEHEDGLEHVTILRAKCAACGRIVRALTIRKNGQLIHRADGHNKPGTTAECEGSLKPVRLMDRVVWPIKEEREIKEIYAELTA